MWKLSIEDDQANQTVVDLTRGEYSIGRDPANTIRLTERNVSRKHARLVDREGGWVLEDLTSYNGCYVNGARVGGEQVVAAGDLIQLGDYRLELVDAQVSQQPDKRTTQPGRQAQTIRELPDRLVMLTGPAVGASFPLLSRRLVIGRGEDCDLPVNDTSVSRVHAEIQAIEGGRYEVVDLESSNGVRVNGVDLKRAILEAGDVVELGDVQFRLVPAGQPFHPQDLGAGAGGRNSLDPGVGAGSDQGRSRARVWAAIGALAVVAAAGVALSRGAAPAPPPVPAADPGPAARALEEARALFAAGDVEGAVRKSQEIPEDSNLRASTTFKEIHARWAEDVFEQASKETDRSQRRALLDLIAKSPDVGSMTRKRAAADIAALDSDSVGIEDLPSARAGKADEPAAAAVVLPEAARGAAPRTAAPAAPAPGAPAPSAPKKRPGDVRGGLVRDTPF